MTTSPFPAELRFNKARAELLIRFDDGTDGAIPYELLRIESPSAETKGHGTHTWAKFWKAELIKLMAE